MTPPKGLLVLKNSGYDWAIEAAEMIEEMADTLKKYATYHEGEPVDTASAMLKRYEEWGE